MNFKFVAILIISSIAYANSQECTITLKSSCPPFTGFNFHILNDINEAYQLYWFNFYGNLDFYLNIASGTTIGVYSLLNFHFILTSASGKIRQFTTGVALFNATGRRINISQIPFFK